MNYYNPSQSWHAGSELWSVKAFVCCLSYHGRWNSHSAMVTWPDTPLSVPACIFYLQRMFCLFTCYHHCINGKIGISFLSLCSSVFWPAFFAHDGSDAKRRWVGSTVPDYNSASLTVFSVPVAWYHAMADTEVLSCSRYWKWMCSVCKLNTE